MPPRKSNTIGKRPIKRKPPAEGKRQVTACTDCRTMKVRCDRKRPSCSRCEKRQTPCEYTEQGDAMMRTIAQSSQSLRGRSSPRSGAARMCHGATSLENESYPVTPRAVNAPTPRSESRPPLRLPSIDTWIRSQDIPTGHPPISNSMSLHIARTGLAYDAARHDNTQSAGLLEKLRRMREKYHAAQQRVQDEEIALPDLEECELEFDRTKAIKQEFEWKVAEDFEAFNAAGANHKVAAVNLTNVRERTRDLSSLKQQALQLRERYNTEWAKLNLDKL